MNTYSKYAPNVFLAKCPERHNKDDEILVTTKYGKENECIVHNLIYERDGFFFYSITRADGFNAQERAKRKAERYQQWAGSAESKSDQYFERADLREEKSGIPLGQPILVGHHSERRHRRVIEQAHNAMDKAVEFNKKAAEHQNKADYWKDKESTINLSMPESIEYYEYKLEAAKMKHEELKADPSKRSHSYSLTYAKKDVNEAEKNLQLAKKLWG